MSKSVRKKWFCLATLLQCSSCEPQMNLIFKKFIYWKIFANVNMIIRWNVEWTLFLMTSVYYFFCVLYLKSVPLVDMGGHVPVSAETV